MLTDAVDFATGELRFPHEDRCCPCSSCGVCKQAPIKDAEYRGRTTVLVGDGASDRKAALLADVVLAKGPLASWCAAFGVRVPARRSRPWTTCTGCCWDEVVVRHRRTHPAHRRGAGRPRGACGYDVVVAANGEWAAVGARVGELVASGECATGVLFCWTGTGAGPSWRTRCAACGLPCAPMLLPWPVHASGTTPMCW